MVRAAEGPLTEFGCKQWSDAKTKTGRGGGGAAGSWACRLSGLQGMGEPESQQG
jgi:hypothetical protein